MSEKGKKMKRQKRAVFDVLSDILKVADKANGVRKTTIVYQANLNFAKAGEYIGMLLEQGFMRNCDGKRNLYVTTEKGRQFLSKYKELIEEFETDRIS